MADDDRALMERLAALEAEVKADADAQRARKAAAVAKLRDQRVTQTAGGAQVSRRTSVTKSPPRDDIDTETETEAGSPRDPLENLGGALELASKANRVKQELARPAKKGDKSWLVSGGLSLFTGPIGWLYAGSLREAVPATAGWIALAIVASKILPNLLLTPILMLVLPLSAIAGIVYALQYNRAGKRQRLFDGKKKPQGALPAPRAGARGKPRG